MGEDDEDDKADVHDRFFRERRLLLGVSIVLLAHQFLGITVEKGVETLGLHFGIESPDKIWWGVWIIWTWTIVCYLQQLNSINLSERFPEELASRTVKNLADCIATARVKRAALKHLCKHVPRPKRQLDVRYIETRAAYEPTTGKNGPNLVRVMIGARWKGEDPQEAARQAASLRTALASIGWDRPRGGDGFESGICRFEAEYGMEIDPLRRRCWIRMVAYGWAAASTSFGTDYLAPVLVGVLPLLFSVSSGLKLLWCNYFP